MSLNIPSIGSGNYVVKKGLVTNSPVINLPTPVNPNDAATKMYVDTHTGGSITTTMVTFTVTLTNTTEVELFSDTIGLFDFYITNNFSGPFAKFYACKSTSTVTGMVQRHFSSTGRGASGSCTLNIKWNANNGIYISKTTNDFNGVYCCSFIPIPLSV